MPVESAVAKALTVPPNTTLALRAGVNKQLVKAFIAKIAARFNRKPVASRLLLRNFKPLVTKSVVGRTVDQVDGVRALTDALVHGTRGTIVLKAKLTKPAAAPGTVGPVIVIRRSVNELRYYLGAKVVRTFGVATGQSVYPTPVGTFSIVDMQLNPDPAKLKPLIDINCNIAAGLSGKS